MFVKIKWVIDMEVEVGVMYRVTGSGNLDSLGLVEDLGGLFMKVDYLSGVSYLYWPVSVGDFRGLFGGPESVGVRLRDYVKDKSYKRL